jgi:hypothetical protein
MCAWAYGTIYGCRPEMDLYLSLLPAVFAVIPVLYTIAASLHESPLAIDYLLYSLLESLLERAAFERAALREE